MKKVEYLVRYADGDETTVKNLSEAVQAMEGEDAQIVVFEDGQEVKALNLSDIFVAVELDAYEKGPHKGHLKAYDLLRDYFISYEEAKAFAVNTVHSSEYNEPIYVTAYTEYITGNYGEKVEEPAGEE